jgi:HEPN domain-containing protein
MKARTDLRSALVLLAAKPPLADAVCFHCQQCTEKVVKALLWYHGIDAPKIHAMNILLDMAVGHMPELERFRTDCEALTSYAVVVRYPIDPEPSTEDAEEALRTAESVYTFVAERLPPEARP